MYLFKCILSYFFYLPFYRLLLKFLLILMLVIFYYNYTVQLHEQRCFWNCAIEFLLLLLLQGRINEGRKIFEEIISLDPQSPRATYGLAVALDMDADRFKSNAMLETAIGLYQEVLELPDVPKTLLILSGRKCSERQAFRGESPAIFLSMSTPIL